MMKIIIVIFTAIIFGSCQFREQKSETNAEQNNSVLNVINESSLEKNRRLWRESKIDNYRLFFENMGWTMNVIAVPFIAEVKKGEVVSIEIIGSKKYNNHPNFKEYCTVEKMFEQIQFAEKSNYKKIEVEYDAKLGFPKRVLLDEPKTSDEEVSWEVSKIEIIE